MGDITFTDGVAIAMLIFYAIALPFAIYNCWRHGIDRASGWVAILIFSVIRIIGSAGQIATISDPDNRTAEIIAYVCQAIGLAPLLVATLGLISRVLYAVLSPSWAMIYSQYVLRLIQLPNLVALILVIVAANISNSIFSSPELHAAIIIYAVILVTITVLYFVALKNHLKTYRGDRPLVIVVGIALPALWIRLGYALAECFGPRDAGSALVTLPDAEYLALFLGELEEMFITLVYLATGMMLVVLPKELRNPKPQDRQDSPLGSDVEQQLGDEYKPHPQGGSRPQPRKKMKVGKGPIHMLVALGYNAYCDYRNNKDAQADAQMQGRY
ncbi:uncharacterized protein N7459_001233 [Penicillium hispanicum]|uniref:uncharacterized protein n=1 Tax=Penicillium hispanicum TaxID=1080232 RepID=UPI00253FEBBF|nr:uncharacterized protein N7459_001233 [Penicillium hispanicum]KAJ5595025.1 hypothetical protein N7459_001233 [Penicillium hispanicum]